MEEKKTTLENALNEQTSQLKEDDLAQVAGGRVTIAKMITPSESVDELISPEDEGETFGPL